MAKKLKRIPYDLVSYIQIETEAIQDANDKMMISSYCLGKLREVEWYIDLLRVGSEKYIVPHAIYFLFPFLSQLSLFQYCILITIKQSTHILSTYSLNLWIECVKKCKDSLTVGYRKGER